MASLELRLLGVPEVRLDGKTVVLTRRSAVALLAYLAVAGGSHPRELLTALFGGDGSEDQARRRLSNALADLRQQLASCLLSSWHIVGLRPDLDFKSDVQSFNSLLMRARESGDADALRAAADLYQGEFLAGLSLTGAPDFEMWLLLHRESYHAQFVQTLEGLVGSAMRRSAWADGAWAAQRLVELEPWHEEAHRQLMRFLAGSGQRHLAVAQFEICRRLLREELDSEPSDETLAVYEELKNGGVVANNLPAQTTTCVGRDNEIRLLNDRLAAQDSRLLSVVGPHGSGKSRLALEAAAPFARTDQPGARRAFRDGVFIVYATDTPDALLPMEIGRVLGIQADGGMPSTAQLSGQSLLLVLDGLENTPAAAQTVADLLASAPGLTLLVTTTAPLRIEGEHVLTIGGLELPTSPEDLEQAAAGALLVAEAQRADMRFTVGTGARPYLVQLCTLVDGLPRGLILAARALSETSPANLVRSIESAGTLETLEAFDRPKDGGMKASDEGDSRVGVARRTAPLALICTPDANAVALVERLREEGMIVCVTHDLHGCLRVATAVGPDVIMIDPRLPRRLEQLLLAHPACSGASIRWLSDPAAVPPTRVQSIVA
jgi:DNA-binding SARP family transcriptional activator